MRGTGRGTGDVERPVRTAPRRPSTTPQRPSGTLTLLFTDIEGSTRLLQRLGEAYPALLAAHHRIVRDGIAARGGIEVSTEGDSFFVVFRSAPDAVAAAAGIQRALAAADWPDGARVAVRMGIHTGHVEVVDGEYVGIEVHRAARIGTAAHGGQVLLSAATRDLAADSLPAGTTLHDLGEHRLKDIDEPVRLWQLTVEGLRADFPPLRTPSARFHILPPELTTFIGRRDQVEAIDRLVARGRFLTLTGPGGTGKSRLAAHVAHLAEARHADGIAFVALAPISDPDLVATTIRHTLGFAEEIGRTPVETLVANLRERDLLLVLDNFEQVLPAAGTVARLLAGTQHVAILVTSRAALRISGEQEYPVPPMTLPQADGPVDPATAMRSEAVALFVDRARMISPSFELDGSNAAAVATICARLDGLPLAIELAASRIRLLPPQALLARLSRRLDLLQSTAADRDDRQRTLRGAIAWSHDLLAGDERAVFRRLAAFVGGASLEAVEALVPWPSGGAGDGDASGVSKASSHHGIDVLAVLEALVAHSLVRLDEGRREPRFGMLETIREYGLERLVEAGEEAAMAERHARWYLERVIALAPSFTAGPEPLDQVQADHDNVRAALRWAIDHGETELAQRAVGALWRFWHLRGHLAEGEVLAREAVAMPGASGVPTAHARAQYGLASVLYWRSDQPAARRAYDASLASAREAGDLEAEAEALYALGYVHALTQDWEAAREAFGRSQALYEAVGARVGSLDARFGLAFTESLAGEWARAAEVFEALIPEFDAEGRDYQAGNTRLVLGRTLQRLGELERAEALIRDGLERSQALGDRTMMAMTLWDLASIAGQRGDLERSMRLAGAAQGIEAEIGARAPKELINTIDPLELARGSGMDPGCMEQLLDEGRLLDQSAALDLARR